MVTPGAVHDAIVDKLNRDCHCVTVDENRLERELEASSATSGLYAAMRERQPHMFSAFSVFVTRAHVDRMQEVVSAVETALSSPRVREEILDRSPAIARIDHGPLGAFLGFDFHLGANGLALIEINTNAGGALLNTVLARAQRACCAQVEAIIAGALGASPERIEAGFVEMFRSEWRRARADDPSDASLRRVAIVDDAPQEQYLQPEFLLFQRLFEGAGIAAVVADPRELSFTGGVLQHDGEPVDLVYNRLTDFALDEPANAALREAYEQDAIVLTPHPRAHALYADKRNLALFSSPDHLSDLGVPQDAIRVLEETVPATEIVRAEERDAWWSRRKKYFWKPIDGFGSRAAYRGDKLTRSTFDRIFTELETRPYVAQVIAPPGERTIEVDGEARPLKLDLRSYVYDAGVQLVAARLYQGQTTKFRTQGGGFAPVFTEAPGL